MNLGISVKHSIDTNLSTINGKVVAESEFGKELAFVICEKTGFNDNIKREIAKDVQGVLNSNGNFRSGLNELNSMGMGMGKLD